MATIRRSGSGWQVLIRRKNYVGPRSRTFLSRDLAQSWADAVEERTKKVFRNFPVTLGEAINDYMNCPLLLHRSAENEKYPLRVTAESWLGEIPLSDLQIKHFGQGTVKPLMVISLIPSYPASAMPSSGLEPETSPLPRECSTAELQGQFKVGRVGFEPT